MTTGEKVKQARIAKGLAQDYIAARLGISKSAVSRCELGQRQFRVDQLYTLANLLDVPPYELVNILKKISGSNFLAKCMGSGRAATYRKRAIII